MNFNVDHPKVSRFTKQIGGLLGPFEGMNERIMPYKEQKHANGSRFGVIYRRKKPTIFYLFSTERPSRGQGKVPLTDSTKEI